MTTAATPSAPGRALPPLRIDGEMTIFRAAELKPLLLASPAPTEIDLAGVTEIDTAGLQLLLLARREALAQQRPLRLLAPSGAVLDLLELLDLGAFFGDALVRSPSGTADAAKACDES